MASSQHFTDVELSCPHCHINACVEPLIALLERIRERVGKPVHVNSAYRCATHNAAVHGAKNSQHINGKAADIYVDGISVGELEAIARACGAVGIGRADYGGYLHVDVRPRPAKWCYDKQNQQVNYYPPKETA